MVELARTERLWSGEMGAAYLSRSLSHPFAGKRWLWWERVQRAYQPASVLEVGCGNGWNLACLLGCRPLVGLDVSATALSEAQRSTQRQAALVRGSAAALPLGDASVDLVLTVGTLIHLPLPSLDTVLDEIGRVARRHVLLIEYEATADQEIPWRGQREVMWKRPFGLRFWNRHPTWRPWESGALGVREGFDDVAYSVFAAPRPADAPVVRGVPQLVGAGA